MRKFFGIVFFVLAFGCIRAQDMDVSEGILKNYKIIANLLSQDKDSIAKAETLSNFRLKDTLHNAVHTFTLTFKNFSRGYLYMNLPSETGFFVNERLIEYYPGPREFLWPLDSIHNQYNNRDSIFITLYQKRKAGDKPLSYIVQADSVNSVSESPLMTRNQQTTRDFFIVTIIILLAGFAFLLNKHPKQFIGIYSIQSLYALRMRDQRLVNTPNMQFIFIHSFVLGFLLLIFQNYGGVFHFDILWLKASGFWGLLLNWLILSLFIFMAIVMKYILIRFLAFIFNFREFGNTHVLEYFRMSIIFFSSIFLIVMLAYLGIGNNIGLLFSWSITLFYIFASIRIIILSLNILRAESFRIIYLISYLCATEIVPLFIGIKILLG